MYARLQTLVDGKHIVAIDAAPVPAPPRSRYPGDHLFINCHYDVISSALPASPLLTLARNDALAICKALAGDASLAECVSVVVTIYGHFALPEAARPARRRIYCVNLLCKDIPEEPRQIDASLLSRLQIEESSQLDEIAELMHQAAH